MLQRLKHKISYCKKYIQDDLELFEVAEIRSLNLLPISSETILVSGGELERSYLKAKIKPSKMEYKVGDRAYINITAPEEADILCTNADYVVKSVLTGHMVTEIIFERRSGD